MPRRLRHAHAATAGGASKPLRRRPRVPAYLRDAEGYPFARKLFRTERLIARPMVIRFGGALETPAVRRRPIRFGFSGGLL
jgi:hypothetical protein